MTRALSDLAPPPHDPAPALDPAPHDALLHPPSRRSPVRRAAELLLVPASLLLLAWAIAQLLTPTTAPPAPAAAVASERPEAPTAPASPPVAAAVTVERSAAPAPATPEPAVGFPADAARGLATRFAVDYLTWDQARPDLRAAALAPYLPAAATDPQAGWDGTGVQLAATPLPVDTTVSGDGRHAVVTVAVRVTGDEAPRWVYLAVPIATDEHRRVAVDGLPSLAPPPDPPTNLPAHGIVDHDAAAAAAAEPAVRQLFADLAATALAGIVELDDLVALTVDAAGGDHRRGEATVRWRDPVTGSGLTQTYRLDLRRDADRWHATLATHP